MLSAPAQRASPDLSRAQQWPWSGISPVRVAVLFATQWDRWVGLAVRQVKDDAYVRGDITPLSAHVEGYVRHVPVDDFQRVKKGEVLVEIEDDDYRARVAQAEADLQAAKAEARGIEAEARSRRWKLQRVVEDLDNQIALLHARVATLDKSKAVLTLAQIDFSRAKQLLGSPAESRKEYDQAQKGCRLPTRKSMRTWPSLPSPRLFGAAGAARRGRSRPKEAEPLYGCSWSDEGTVGARESRTGEQADHSAAALRKESPISSDVGRGYSDRPIVEPGLGCALLYRPRNAVASDQRRLS